MVGLRAFEVVAPKKKPKSDLLYVYTGDQSNQLRQGGHLSWLSSQEEGDKTRDCSIVMSKDAPSYEEQESNDKNWEETFMDI